jgi:hypothetical protein
VIEKEFSNLRWLAGATMAEDSVPSSRTVSAVSMEPTERINKDRPSGGGEDWAIRTQAGIREVRNRMLYPISTSIKLKCWIATRLPSIWKDSSSA